jgi:hypothetical protein
VYSLTTTSGQGKGAAAGPPPASLPLPYTNDLSAGSDEPDMLAAEDGAFELAPCHSPNGSTTCALQTAVNQPVLWVPSTGRHPYAIIGSNWRNYVVSVDAMVPRSGSAGLIGRYDGVAPGHGAFNGYVFDVNTDGTFTLTLNHGGTAAYTASGQRQLTAPWRTVLARGQVPFAPGTWHTLSLSVSGTTIAASVDGQHVASLTDATLTHGMPGIEVGGWYRAYFSNLTVTSP